MADDIRIYIYMTICVQYHDTMIYVSCSQAWEEEIYIFFLYQNRNKFMRLFIMISRVTHY